MTTVGLLHDFSKTTTKLYQNYLKSTLRNIWDDSKTTLRLLLDTNELQLNLFNQYHIFPPPTINPISNMLNPNHQFFFIRFHSVPSLLSVRSILYCKIGGSILLIPSHFDIRVTRVSNEFSRFSLFRFFWPLILKTSWGWAVPSSGQVKTCQALILLGLVW